MQRTLSWTGSLVALAGLSVCGCGLSERCKRDQARVGIMQRQLDRVEARSRLLQGSLHRERTRIAQLERDLTRVRRKLARYPQARRIAVSPPRAAVYPDRLRWKEPAVSMTGVRFWDRAHRKWRSTVTTGLRRLVPRWKRCYHKYGWGRGKEHSLLGVFWIIYGVQQNAVINPRVSGSSLRLAGMGTSASAVAKQRRALRASRLEQCFVKAMGKLGPRAGSKMIRIAAEVHVAAHRAHAIIKLGFKWPWKRVQRRRSGPRQVCQIGSQWRSYDRLRPSIARPCKRGLKCCYPCGIGGCNSVCLSRCPGPLP